MAERIYEITQREASPKIRERTAFRAGSIRGHVIIDRGVQMGELPAEFIQKYVAHRPTYVVMSYMTPIAWWSPNEGWCVPEVRYSKTTSKHQYLVRRAIKS